MDRNEALKLLKGGLEGVAEWNQRRKAGEEILDLRRADLRQARLARIFHPPFGRPSADYT